MWRWDPKLNSALVLLSSLQQNNWHTKIWAGQTRIKSINPALSMKKSCKFNNRPLRSNCTTMRLRPCCTHIYLSVIRLLPRHENEQLGARILEHENLNFTWIFYIPPDQIKGLYNAYAVYDLRRTCSPSWLVSQPRSSWLDSKNIAQRDHDHDLRTTSQVRRTDYSHRSAYWATPGVSLSEFVIGA